MAADDLAEPFEYLLVRVADGLRRRFALALRPIGLTPRQFSALSVLARTPGMTAAELARAVLVTPQSTGPLLDQLESTGLIAPRPRRGRGVAAPVQLTDEGRRRLARATERVDELNAATRELLGDDAARLAEALRRLEHGSDGTDRGPAGVR